MFNTRVFNVMITSPSDVIIEKKIIHDCLYEWNDINAEAYHIVFRVLDYQKNAHPDSGVHPQESINKQLLQNADFVIAIFWTRIGSPTPGYQSGSIEEIVRHMANDKKAFIYFKEKSTENLSDIDYHQYEKVKQFQEDMKGNVLYCSFHSDEDFRDILRKDIQSLANELKDKYKTDNFNTAIPIDIDISDLTEMEKNILTIISISPEKQLRYIEGNGGYANGYVVEELEILDFKDALITLQEKQLIRKKGGSDNVFCFTRQGKEFCDKFPELKTVTAKN